MNAKKMLPFVLLIGILLIAGCNSTNSSQTDLTKTYIGGTVGLNAYLIEGMPPPQIHDGGTFDFAVGIALENKGESDVGPGTGACSGANAVNGCTQNDFVLIRIEGINPQQFGIQDRQTRQMLGAPLRGAKRNFDGTIFPGEITTAIFPPDNSGGGMKYMPNIRGNTQMTIRADICYDYENVATSQICIKDDVLENIQDTSICSLTGEKNPQNSGGPIHITSLVENPMGPNKIQVNFVIEHVGIGEFFGRTPTEQCGFSANNTNKYYVYVDVQPTDSSLQISCSRLGGSRAGKVKLYGGLPTTISCVINLPTGSHRVYQELLNIKLQYRYGQFIETPIIIQDVTN